MDIDSTARKPWGQGYKGGALGLPVGLAVPLFRPSDPTAPPVERNPRNYIYLYMHMCVNIKCNT